MSEGERDMSSLGGQVEALSICPYCGDLSDVIDTDLLIAEVKKFPALYQKAHERYLEKIDNFPYWVKVCKSLFKQWDELSSEKKKENIKMAQTKWQKLTDIFFYTYEATRNEESLESKRNKTSLDTLAFLIHPTDASDVSVGSCDFHKNSNELEISGVIPIDVPLLPETPLAPTPRIKPVPSTSAPEIQFAKAYDYHPAQGYIPINELIPPSTIDPNPNTHFALMLVPLLNRLTQEQLYKTWPQILQVIKDGEGKNKITILQHELAGESVDNLVQDPVVDPVAQPDPEPEEQDGEKEPVYPCTYGRPTNEQGEIMYPETDNEDDEI